MNPQTPHPFPETNPFKARDVTELDFNIEPYRDQLYVDLDQVRSAHYWNDLEFSLNLADGQLVATPENYSKIVFSGHRGCGKSTELRRFHRKVNHPGGYVSIFLDLEREAEIATFESQDLFVLLVGRLIERLDQEGITDQNQELNWIIGEWLSNEEVRQDLKTNYRIDLSGEAGGGVNFFEFLKLQSRFKSIFSHGSTTAKTIRRMIKQNTPRLIDRFNLALGRARRAFHQQNKGKDLLFIVDGSERLDLDTYRRLFLTGAHLIHALQTQIIFSIPIYTFFDIEHHSAAEFFHTYVLPMISLEKDPQAATVLGRVITQRIDHQHFFETGVLEYCIAQSGGCPRQLLRIVNAAIVRGAGRKITRAIAETVCKELGQVMRDQLSAAHMEILKSGDFYNADIEVRELLFSLVILKYNGKRRVNPLIEPFLFKGD